MDFILFHEEASSCPLSLHISYSSLYNTHGEAGTLTFDCKVVSYLFESYATDDIFSDIDTEILHFTSVDFQDNRVCQSSSECSIPSRSILRGHSYFGDFH